MNCCAAESRWVVMGLVEAAWGELVTCCLAVCDEHMPGARAYLRSWEALTGELVMVVPVDVWFDRIQPGTGAELMELRTG